MEIVVLDGYTINPGDNPWTPVERSGPVDIDNSAPVFINDRHGDGLRTGCKM